MTKGSIYRKFGGSKLYEVYAIRGNEIGVRANELDVVEWWDKERFDFKKWVKNHGKTRTNFSGHKVNQTIFVKP